MGGIFMFFRLLQLLKAELSIVIIEAGRVISVRLVQDVNVAILILVIGGGNSTFVRLEQKAKAYLSIKVTEEGIIPPLNSIPGLGTVAAQGIQEARKDGSFMSIDDLKIRSKVGKSVIEMLTNAGCLKGMSQSNQMSLFA